MVSSPSVKSELRERLFTAKSYGLHPEVTPELYWAFCCANPQIQYCKSQKLRQADIQTILDCGLSSLTLVLSVCPVLTSDVIMYLII